MEEGILDVKRIEEDSYIMFSWFDVERGFKVERVAGGAGRTIIRKFTEEEVNLLTRYNRYYDNGMCAVYYKYPR